MRIRLSLGIASLLLMFAATGLTASSASAARRVIAHRYLNARRGGVVRASNGVEIKVPPRTMDRSGLVTIARVGLAKFNIHIYPSWAGRVRVTMPVLPGRTPVVLHTIGKVNTVASHSVGQMTVWTNHLSPFNAGIPDACNDLLTDGEAVGPGGEAAGDGGYAACVAGYGITQLTVYGIGELAHLLSSHHKTSSPTKPTPAPSPTPAPPPTPAPSPAPTPGPTPAPTTGRVTLAQGPSAPSGYRYAVTLAGYPPESSVSITCYDSASPAGFYSFALATDSSGAASTASYCYSGAGPDHWVVAGGVESNHVEWTSGGTTPAPPSQSIQIGWSGAHSGWIWMTLNGFPVGSHQYSCDFGSGGDQTFTLGEGSSPETWDNGHTCYDFIHGDTVWVTVEGITSNTIVVP
jgi:hypothetical protein